MARLHIDVSELASEIDLALAHLRRGGEVLLERHGEVVARLEPATPTSRPGAPEHTAPASIDPMPGTGSPFAAAMAMLRERGDLGDPGAFGGLGALGEGWDELAREEEFLEMLAGEMAMTEEGLSWSPNFANPGPNDS